MSDSSKESSQTPIETELAQEVIEPAEEALIESIRLITEERMRRTYGPGETVQRDAHAKTHGLVKAKFTVVDNLPDQLRHGVFAEPKTFEALVRFSASALIAQPDTAKQPQGMAIKLMEVEGEKLVAPSTTQDFVMINFPVFFCRDLDGYVDFMRLNSAISLKPDDGGNLEAAAAEFANKQPRMAAVIEEMKAVPFFNPLQVQYWSETPYLLGPNAIKYSAKPLTSRENKKPEGELSDTFMREALVETIGKEIVQFEFLVQVQNDPAKQPIEDPMVEWDESEAPPQRVAILEIPVQDLSSDEDLKLAEKLAFAVWNSLPAHRPLGSMNRTRRVVYESGMKVRHARNHNVQYEPTPDALYPPE